MARPKKYNIDTKEVVKLASYGCTNKEIADFFDFASGAGVMGSVSNRIKI